MSKTEEILLSLEPLFEKAEKEKLWFYCSYQGMWFSPKQLKECHKKGRFIWGADNWNLRNPLERVTEIEEDIKSLQIQKDIILKKIQEEV